MIGKSGGARDTGLGRARPAAETDAWQYQPALDGIRAVAVTMVLLFHGGISWMSGGYFGVSVFFTLSGFLITSLLVREFDRTRRVAPGAFYARRAKRLLPASITCVGVVALLAHGNVWTGANHVRRDAWSALLQVANWVRLFAGESYTDLQSKSAGLKSPLDHYWSLAIEEQFYWIWPIAFWLLARWARRRGWGLTAPLAVVTAVFGAAAPVIALVWGRDAAYWATPARTGEIMVGALLAVALAEGLVHPRRWMAPAGGATVVALGVVLPAAGGPAYHGAFPLLAMASAALILGVQRPGSVTTMLSRRPVAALGKISYGVYLYHFPAFVLLTTARTHVVGIELFGARVAATLACAIVSYWLIERPIRLARWSGVRTVSVASAGLFAAAAVVLVVPAAAAPYWSHTNHNATVATIPVDNSVPPLLVQPPAPTTAATEAVTGPPSSSAVVTTTTAAVTDDEPTSTSGAPAGPEHLAAVMQAAASLPSVPATLPALSRPVRIVLVGDSTMMALGVGFGDWAAQHPDVAQVTVLASPGCGFVRHGIVPSDQGVPFAKGCNDVLDKQLPKALQSLHPDVVMLMTTMRDVMPRQFDPAQPLEEPTDPLYNAVVHDDYAAITQTILDTSSAEVVWVRPVLSNPWWQDVHLFFNDPVIHAPVDDVMAEQAAMHPDRVEVLDFRTWFEHDVLADSHDARPDGTHLSEAAALDVTNRFFGPELVLAATHTG